MKPVSELSDAELPRTLVQASTELREACAEFGRTIAGELARPFGWLADLFFVLWKLFSDASEKPKRKEKHKRETIPGWLYRDGDLTRSISQFANDMRESAPSLDEIELALIEMGQTISDEEAMFWEVLLEK